MSNSTALAIRPETITALATETGFSRAQVGVVHRVLMKGEGDEADMWLFLTRCQRTGLDPFAGQIAPVFRWDTKQGRKVMAIQTQIDGFRLIGHRALKGRFRGMAGPLWKAKGGEWVDLWEEEGAPYAAKVGIYVDGCAEPTWGIVKWDEFKQTYVDKQGKERLFPQWASMPAHMLAKCAEAQAWRKVAPQDTANLQIAEEIPAVSEKGQAHAQLAAARDVAYINPPRAASDRFHTEPRAIRPQEPTETEYEEIVENAEGDGEPPEEDSIEEPPASESQLTAIAKLAGKQGVPEGELDRVAREMYGRPFADLSASQASDWIRNLQTNAQAAKWPGKGA